jgi:hypothetical protein
MSFERLELDWLLDLWEATPTPWPRPLVLAWMRYADGCVLRGVRYWVPARCCTQVRSAAHAGERPGRRAVADVTGLGEKAARLIHERIELWRDPYREEAGARVGSQEGPKKGPPDDTQVRDITTGRGPAGAQQGPGLGPDRASSPRASTDPPITDPPEEDKTQEARASTAQVAKPPVLSLVEPDPLPDLWARLTSAIPGAWKLTPSRRTQLRARVDEHGIATVERVAAWLHSGHERARFLVERGDVDTVIRASKFATYAAMSAAPMPTARGAPPGRDRSTAGLAEAFADLARDEVHPPEPPPRTAIDVHFEVLR